MVDETDRVILFVPHENESFTLLTFGQILVCQNQKLQILSFMIYKAPGAQLAKKLNMIIL